MDTLFCEDCKCELTLDDEAILVSEDAEGVAAYVCERCAAYDIAELQLIPVE